METHLIVEVKSVDLNDFLKEKSENNAWLKLAAVRQQIYRRDGGTTQTAAMFKSM